MTPRPSLSSATLEGISGAYHKDTADHVSHHVEESSQLTWTDEEERELVRKVDAWLLPTVWIMSASRAQFR